MKTKAPNRPEGQRRYCYWVEICDLRDGSVRNLPLRAVRLVHLHRKRGEPPKPDGPLLQLQDDTTVIEASDLDERAATQRSRYPDATHERRLHWERDLDAEQRYADALDALTELLVDAAVNDLLREPANGQDEAQRTRHSRCRAPMVRRSRPRRTSQSRS